MRTTAYFVALKPQILKLRHRARKSGFDLCESTVSDPVAGFRDSFQKSLSERIAFQPLRTNLILEFKQLRDEVKVSHFRKKLCDGPKPPVCRCLFQGRLRQEFWIGFIAFVWAREKRVPFAVDTPPDSLANNYGTFLLLFLLVYREDITPRLTYRWIFECRLDKDLRISARMQTAQLG